MQSPATRLPERNNKTREANRLPFFIVINEILVQTLAVLFCNFFETLATSSGLNTLLSLRRLLVTLIALDVGNNPVLFAGLGEALESSFEWFVRFYDYADHDDPLGLNFAVEV